MKGGLTVALPVYNAMPYLPEAVESILRQTYEDFEFIIIDDGSTDGSWDYLSSLDDARLQTLHRENRGLGATLNQTIEMSRTEFYARMDADDVSLPNRLATQLAIMAERPELSVLGTQVSFMAGARTLPARRMPLEHGAIRRQLVRGVSGMCHASAMLRTKAGRRVGGYRIQGAGEDFDFLLRMSEVGRLANCEQVLYEMRLHRGSTTLARRMDIYRGIAYAAACASCRQRGEPEPLYEEFAQRWAKRPWPVKVRDAVDDWSGRMYRHALIDLGEGGRIAGTARMAAAACLRPRAALRQVVWRISTPSANGKHRG